MMLEKRQHKRFRLDLIELNGTLNLADKIEIIDISFGGVALKVNRRLYIGKECLFKLEDKRNSIDVKGIVVRCKLSGFEERCNRDRVSIYTAGMRFQEGSADTVADFIRSSISA
jgi:hypothetical protein